jgi:hypothetical protein
MIRLALCCAVLCLGACKPKPHELAQAPDSFECSTDAECAALPPCALKPGCDGGPNSEPYRLIGYGCRGSAVPLYRDHEDEFPAPCRDIHPIWER